MEDVQAVLERADDAAYLAQKAIRRGEVREAIELLSESCQELVTALQTPMERTPTPTLDCHRSIRAGQGLDTS